MAHGTNLVTANYSGYLWWSAVLMLPLIYGYLSLARKLRAESLPVINIVWIIAFSLVFGTFLLLVPVKFSRVGESWFRFQAWLYIGYGAALCYVDRERISRLIP